MDIALLYNSCQVYCCNECLIIEFYDKALYTKNDSERYRSVRHQPIILLSIGIFYDIIVTKVIHFGIRHYCKKIIFENVKVCIKYNNIL